MADPQDTSTAAVPAVPPPPSDKYDYSGRDRFMGLVNHLTGGGLPKVQQQIEEDHQRRLNEMGLFQQQMGTLGQALASGKDPSTGEAYYDGTGNLTPAGQRTQHQFEMARDEYMKRATVSKNAKPIAEKVFDFAHGVIHHSASQAQKKAMQPGGSAGPATAPATSPTAGSPAVPPPPASVSSAPPVAAPASASGASPSPPNPSVASASNGAAPGPSSVSAPGAGGDGNGSGKAIPPPPIQATASSPATGPAIAPPPGSGDALLSAYGAPAMQRQLEENEKNRAAGGLIRSQLEARKGVIDQVMKENPGMTQRDALMYVAAIEGRAMPYQMLRGQKATVVGADGKPQLATYDPYSGGYMDMKGDVIPDAKPFVSSLAKPRIGWSRDAGGIYSVGLDPQTNQPIPGTENRNALPPPGYLTKVHQGFTTFTDDDGNVTQVPTTTTSSPALPGGGSHVPPPPSASATSAPAKPPASSGTSPSSGGPRIIGHKLPPTDASDYRAAKTEVHKAQTDYQSALDRMRTMDENLIDGKKGDQQAMLSLVANHIGMTLGMQKGARITRAVWDEAVQSAPWLGRVESHFDKAGYLTGVTLTPEQMDSMVKLGHQKVDIMKQHVDDVKRTYADDLAKGAHHAKSVVAPPPGQESQDDEIKRLAAQIKGKK